jgi:hypothetical protein
MRKIIDFLLLKKKKFYFEKKVAQNYKFISCYNDHHNEEIKKNYKFTISIVDYYNENEFPFSIF